MKSVLFEKIKLIACDFDGVLTDNRVIIDENGKESVICSRSDGFGIEQLKKNSIEVIVISKEKNKVVAARCKKLGIQYFHSIERKIEILKEEIKKRGLNSNEVCFIGNDLNDIECMRYVVGIAVNDAVKDVKEIASYIIPQKGGYGVIREVADLILKSIDSYPN